MAQDAQALLNKEAGLQKAMVLRKELSDIAKSLKDPRFETVVMQLDCACNSIVLARNTFDELVSFANYSINK